MTIIRHVSKSVDHMFCLDETKKNTVFYRLCVFFCVSLPINLVPTLRTPWASSIPPPGKLEKNIHPWLGFLLLVGTHHPRNGNMKFLLGQINASIFPYTNWDHLQPKNLRFLKQQFVLNWISLSLKRKTGRQTWKKIKSQKLRSFDPMFRIELSKAGRVII